MPRYDFACSKCGHEFEKSLRMDDRKQPTEEPCVQCGEMAVGMRIATPMIVSGVKTANSAPDGFKDVLREIKNQSGKGCSIDV